LNLFHGFLVKLMNHKAKMMKPVMNSMLNNLKSLVLTLWEGTSEKIYPRAILEDNSPILNFSNGRRLGLRILSTHKEPINHSHNQLSHRYAKPYYFYSGLEKKCYSFLLNISNIYQVTNYSVRIKLNVKLKTLYIISEREKIFSFIYFDHSGATCNVNSHLRHAFKFWKSVLMFFLKFKSYY
jgi:hypothetical protein